MDCKFVSIFYAQLLYNSSRRCMLFNNNSVSSLHSHDQLGHWGDRRDDSSDILFQFFSMEGHHEQFWHGQGCPLFDSVHLAFPLVTTASPILQGVLKSGFGEAVMEPDMPKSCDFSSTDSCQKRFLWAHKEADLAPHPVVGCKSGIKVAKTQPALCVCDVRNKAGMCGASVYNAISQRLRVE